MLRLEAYAFRLPCTKRGFSYFKEGFRPGFLFHFAVKDAYGISEYAPFFLTQSLCLNDSLAQLESLDEAFVRQLFALDEMSPLKKSEFFSPHPLGPFLSMAHLYHRLNLNTGDYDPKASLPLAALIEASCGDEAKSLALAYVSQGFSCLKIKVGDRALKDEIKKVSAIADVVGPHVALRLDANKKFTFDEAKALLKGLGRIKLEYFEEPLADISRARDLGQETGVALAVDESFPALLDCSALALAQIKFLVIKPNRFKNIYEALHILEEARCHQIIPVLSHCFESEFSTALWALLLHQMRLADHAHGILAEGFFKHGVLGEPLRAFRGKLFLKQAAQIFDRRLLLESPYVTKLR